jgi:hypothetical protein
MSWLFSRALVAEFSAGTCLDGGPSAQLNVMPTPHKFWRNDKTMEPSDHSRFGLTSAVLTAGHGAALLTSFLAAFPVRTSASPAKAPVSMASDRVFGERCSGSWAKFDPGSSMWRTAQYSLLGGLEQFSETWPRSGLMLRGECFPLPIAELRTSESAFGLWPTPVASDTGARPRKYAQGGTPLSLAARTWPTPTTVSGNAVGRLDEWGGSGARRMTSDLPHHERTGPLNPPWVEWLMGWPIGWSDLQPLETDKFQEWQQLHGNY